MYEKKLSIIIPTRNRQKYAYNCIETLVSYNYENYEIVVQDNSDDDSLKGMLENISSDKIIYNYDPGEVSFCQNFENAILASSGDYLMMIGDDDVVLPYAFDLVEKARLQEIEAITYLVNISYEWPQAFSNSQTDGRLVIRGARNYSKKIDCSKAALKMLKSGNFNYQEYNFPKIYHGIIKRSVFDKVKESTGFYFRGLSPDIYSAVALSFFVKKMIYVSFPFSVNGICPKSGSADSKTGRHTGELSEAPHFRGTNNYQWEDNIPYKYAVDTIWAETATKALKDCKKQEYLKRLNYFKFISRLILGNKQHKEFYVDYYAKLKGKRKWTTKISLKFSCFFLSVKKFIYRGCLFLYRKLLGRYVYSNVKNISQATQIIMKNIKNSPKL